MNGAKIKNLIILMLLLVNVFLFGLVLTDRHEAAAGREAAWDDLAAVFQESGIVLSPGVREAVALQGCSLRRDTDSEASLASNLLGAVSAEDQGGNIYYYKGEKGEATFRGTGEFSILLNPGTVESGHDPVQTAVAVLKKIGVRCDPDSAEVKEPGEGASVTLTVSWQEDPVYNAQVTLTFSGGSLYLISGRRMLDTMASRGETGLAPETLLMRFLDAIHEGGYVCSAVESLRCGYIVSVSISGDADLIPVWRVDTDAGPYYLNGLTGKEESLS
jgi:hypothetical protein